MNSPLDSLTRTPFGYDPAEVEQALQRQAAINETKLQSLRQAIAAERSRHEQIQSFLLRLEGQPAALRSLLPQLEGAVRRADGAAPELSGVLAQRVQQIEAAAGERRLALETRVHALGEEVQAELRRLEEATEQIETLAPQPGGSQEPVAAPEPTESAEPAEPTQSTQPALPARPDIPPTSGNHATPPNRADETAARGRIRTDVARLLTGKAVGQDLLDAGGNRLAARGETITPELAARAESAGVLPDLILHMAWPGEVRS